MIFHRSTHQSANFYYQLERQVSTQKADFMVTVLSSAARSRSIITQGAIGEWAGDARFHVGDGR